MKLMLLTARLLLFDTVNYTLELNVTDSPKTVRIEIPYGAVVKDGNLSSAGAFEFRRRINHFG